MKIDGTAYRSVWVDPDDGWSVHILDQTKLPWSLDVLRLTTRDEAAHAIKSMQTRGAPLIGAVAAYALCLALRADASSEAMEQDAELINATRPTAVNLRWALDRMLTRLRNTQAADRVAVAYAEAALIADEDVAQNKAIGQHGLPLIRTAARRGRPVNVLTHCNAGWLATVDWGTALAPIYTAFNAGIDLHVWVDETRPRNQGAALTAWELGKHGVPHTRSPEAARPRGHGHRRRGPRHAHRRRRQQDRHLPESARRTRQQRAVLGRDAVHHHRLDAIKRRERHTYRGTIRQRGHGHDRPIAEWLHRHDAHHRQRQRGGQQA